MGKTIARRATLADVAKAVGLGKATVSRALAVQDHPDVSASTRERVRKVAKDLGYRPSVTARALRSGKFRALSVIVPDEGWGWFEPIVLSAFRAAAAEGYQLLVHPVAGMEGGEAAVVRSLVDVPTEGVIVSGSASDTTLRDAAANINLPIVAIEDRARTVVIPTISVQNRAAARSAVEHLIGLGRQRIAILLPQEEDHYVSERLAGYFDAIDAAELPRDSDLVIRCADEEDGMAVGWPELDQKLRRGVHIDGLFCIGDHLAGPALRSLRVAGLSVPHDAAVVGFDDWSLARLLDPALSTMRQPYTSMGVEAVKTLLRAIQGENVEVARVEFPAELIIRGSSQKR